MANNGAIKENKGAGGKRKYVTIEEFEAKMNEMKTSVTSMNDKIKIMKEVMDRKDQLISSLSVKVGKLEAELEHVKDSQNFITKETSDIKNTMNRSISDSSKKIEELGMKTVDLEDRSRRDNIVVFGVPEDPAENKPEDTERILTKILMNHGLIDKDHDMDHDPVFHRVHRIGPKKDNTAKPRPIICKCVYYKDRQEFLRGYVKLIGTGYSIAEDYSKPTLAVRRQLIHHAKTAKEKNPNIMGFKLNFKRLVIKYINKNTQQTYFRGFSLNEIEQNNNWHESATKYHGQNTYKHGNGYQG